MEPVSVETRALLEVDSQAINLNQGAIYLFKTMSEQPMSLSSLRGIISKNLIKHRCLRQRVIDPVIRFANPHWLLDPNFDINHQVRKLTLPSTVAWQGIVQTFSELSEQKLDPGSPLWRIYLISLVNNAHFPKADFGLLLLSHKALTQRLKLPLLRLLIDKPHEMDVAGQIDAWVSSECMPEALPSRNALLSRARDDLMNLPARLEQSSRRWINQCFKRCLDANLLKAGQDVSETTKAPWSMFNRRVACDRVHGSISWSYTQLQAFSMVYKDTCIRDILVLTVTRMLRQYLLSQNGLPRRNLVGLVNQYTQDASDDLGQLLCLPTTVSEPGNVLRFVRAQRKRLTEQLNPYADTLQFDSASVYLIQTKTRRPTRYFRLPQFNVLMTFDERKMAGNLAGDWCLDHATQFGELYPNAGLHVYTTISDDHACISFSSTTAMMNADLFQETMLQSKTEVLQFMQAGMQTST